MAAAAAAAAAESCAAASCPEAAAAAPWEEVAVPGTPPDTRALLRMSLELLTVLLVWKIRIMASRSARDVSKVFTKFSSSDTLRCC